MSDAFRFETFVDVHSNIFNEMCIRDSRSIWRETRLAFLLIFILVIPKINLPFGDAFLEYSVDFFVEKRKTDRLQMPVFLLS